MTYTYTNNYARPKTYPLDLKKIDPLLVSLLGICTPHKFEKHVARVVTNNINRIKHTHTIEDLNGNLLVTVGGKDPQTMFSCHMDMIGNVDKRNADNGHVDKITLMTDVLDKGYIWGAKEIFDEDGEFQKFELSTLGADDKVGVYINLKMIEQNIPGLYVFHIGEEVGGVGSAFLSKNHTDRFSNIKRAIAFDRANYSDVICFQRGGRCCSDKFGEALATQLNTNMPKFEKYKSGVTGTFTDTANYRDIIPECTNISVGYFNQHGPNEKLDYIFLRHILLPSVLKIDYNALPTERDPKEVPKPYVWKNNNNYSSTVKRKSWKEATDNTLFMEFPKWNPGVGYPKEAQPSVLIKAIRNYLFELSTLTMQDKDKFSEYLYDLMNYNDMIKDECVSQNQQIKLLTGKEIQAAPKQIETAIKEVPKSTVTDLDVTQRKCYIRALIEAGKNVKYESKNNADRVSAYSKGGTTLLERFKDKKSWDDFSIKERKKLNRVLGMLSYHMSLEPLIESTTKLVIDVEDYIEKHLDEEGFGMDVPKFTIH